MKHTYTVLEQVSAFADGHLSDEEFDQVLGQLCTDGDLRATWQTYHVVGDVLRSGVHSACSDSTEFLSRFQQRLATEPAASLQLAESVARPQPHAEAANEPVFRWKLVAGAASLAAAAAIGWNWVGGAPDAQGTAAQLAQQTQSGNSVLAAGRNPASTADSALVPMRVVVGSGAPQVMLRDPRIDQLLEAHQQVGGASQMPSGFLRNATFEGQQR